MGIIQMRCACGAVGAIAVEDPSALSEADKQAKFKERGWKHGRCTWCQRKRWTDGEKRTAKAASH
jgi:hypothetical protein